MISKISKQTLILAMILILAAFFRLYNVNWDSGYQMHPDERAITMAVDKLKFPSSLNEFFSEQSSWNPQFFAYGSFPMYLLKATGSAINALTPPGGSYYSINLVGRSISAIFDVLTVYLIFIITRRLLNAHVGLFSAFFYAIAVLPIQLSHFFAVDTILTCFITATLYCLIRFYEKPNFQKASHVGLFFGLALATKISAVVLIASIGAALIADFILVFLKNPHRPKHWLPHLPKSVIHLLRYMLIINASAFATFVFFEPYALIDFKNFWGQTLTQSNLTKDPFYFPYTLHYVGKIPYLYELKNIFFWGFGPIVSMFAFVGTTYFTLLFFRKDRDSQFAKELILFVFFIVYFLIVGRFAVGFMRYMLPIYPIFAIFAAITVYKILNSIKPRLMQIAISYLLLSICLIWPLSYIRIYSKPNTRIIASNWIYNNVSFDKTLAIEHWDDQIPIGNPTSFNTQILKLYDQDSDEKWNEIKMQLSQTDYIIIASNRLYDPLQKLTDCNNLPAFRCYPNTAKYYQDLFSGNLGFKKVTEFTSYPTIPFLNIEINDQNADESFTVFDHPKIMIFQKIPKHSTM